MTQTAIATIKTTIQIAWTSAPLIRMSTNVDMPEYGLKADQTFYLVRSSKNDNSYYIAVWNYDETRWTCRCPATVAQCRHVRLINADCHKLAEARRAAKLERAERAAAKRAAELFAEIDAECARQPQPETATAEPAADLVATVNAELAKVGQPAATTEEIAAMQQRCLLPNTDQVAYFLQLSRRAQDEPITTQPVIDTSTSTSAKTEATATATGPTISSVEEGLSPFVRTATFGKRGNGQFSGRSDAA